MVFTRRDRPADGLESDPMSVDVSDVASGLTQLRTIHRTSGEQSGIEMARLERSFPKSSSHEELCG